MEMRSGSTAAMYQKSPFTTKANVSSKNFFGKKPGTGSRTGASNNLGKSKDNRANVYASANPDQNRHNSKAETIFGSGPLLSAEADQNALDDQRIA